MADPKELDNLLMEPLPWEIRTKKRKVMAEAEVGDWSSMIGSKPT